MMNEEARKILIQNTESLKANPLVTVDDCLYEAFDIAVKALGQTDVLEKVRAEIEDLTYYSWEISPRTVIDDVLEIIDKYRNGGAE